MIGVIDMDENGETMGILDCVLGCLVFGAKSNGDRKFLDSCSTGRAVCICSGHKRCYAVAGFRYIFMLHIVV